MFYLSKKIDEREKELKEFYKSESESDDENDKDYTPADGADVHSSHILDSTNEQFPAAEFSNQTLNSDIDITKENDNNEKLSNYGLNDKELNPENDVIKEADETERLPSFNSNEQELSTEKTNEEIELNKESTTSLDMTNFALQHEDNEVVDDQSNDKVNENSEESGVLSETLYSVNKSSENNSNKPFQYNDLDKEIEEFNSNREEEKEESRLSKIELLKQKLGDIQPRLSGGPNDIIDLETGTTIPDEISRLKQRFLEQTAKKHIHKNVKLK